MNWLKRSAWPLEELAVGAGRLKWRAIWATRVGLPLSLRFLQAPSTSAPALELW